MNKFPITIKYYFREIIQEDIKLKLVHPQEEISISTVKNINPTNKYYIAQ